VNGDISLTANLTRAETADRAAGIHVERIAVELDLRAARDTASDTFPVVSTLTFAATVEYTWIDFIGHAVDEVLVNGRGGDIAWDGARIRIDGLASHNVVTVRARGRYSRSGEGLHRFRDPVDDQIYLYTQFEPADCRRAYPCFEQPDMKARWLFRIEAPGDWIVLSNAPEASRTPVDGGVRVAFAETLPLSSYITAVAAGPYHRVDGVWEGPCRPVALGLLCRASLARYLDADEILGVTGRGLSLFSEAFAYEYPWGKYDQLFAPEYNLGAMENPGLVTFTESYLYRGASTVAQREARANTILHEMAHMWFGDLATPRWWDDLWLKESFADFMGSFGAVAAGGYPDAWVSFASRRKGWAYEQDQLPTTHPIVADIVDLEAAKLNFDGITYAKGASVLKQLVAFVGEGAFFRGAQRYFADHAFGSTTLADLLAALEETSGRDLRAWSEAWLKTTGVSELRVERDGALQVVQTDPRPHRITVGFYADEDGVLVRRAAADLDLIGAHTAIDATRLPDADLIIPNDDDRTYAKVRLDDRSIDALERGLSTITDSLARSVVWAALWNAVRDGELTVARYLAITRAHAPGETSAALLTDAIGHAGHAIAHYATTTQRPAFAATWLATTWSALLAAAPGSDAQLAWARGVGSASGRCDDRAAELRALLRGESDPPAGLRLDPDLRWSWLTALSATGWATVADADAELARDATATGRSAHRAVLAARPDASVKTAAWLEAWEDETLTNDHLDATVAGIRAGGRDDLLAALEGDYFSRLRAVWSMRSIEISRRLVRGLFPASDSLDAVDAWLAANEDAPGSLRRIVIEQRDGLARDLRVRSVQPRNG